MTVQQTSSPFAARDPPAGGSQPEERLATSQEPGLRTLTVHARPQCTRPQPGAFTLFPSLMACCWHCLLLPVRCW